MVCPSLPSTLQHFEEGMPPFGTEPLAFPGSFPGVPGAKGVPVRTIFHTSFTTVHDFGAV